MKRLATVCWVLAAISLAAAGVGLILGPEWIERVTGLEPDGGDGSFEALLVVTPAVAAAAFGLGGWMAGRLAARGPSAERG